MPGIRAIRATAMTAAVALAICLAASASAQVGVVSVTDGSSSMRQGHDLQVGQPITTSQDGRIHLMFIDGSAVTVGPNSIVAIETYAYDAAAKTGALTLNVEQGTIRFVGGGISKTTDVQIRTPSSMVGIRGGIATVAVTKDGATTANFLYGSAMRVTGEGLTQTATRSGSQINVPAGGRPASPTVLAPGQLANVQALDRAPTNAVPTTVTAGAMAGDTFGGSGLSNHGSTSALQPSAIAAGMPLSSAAQQAMQQAQSSQIRQIGLQLTPSPTAVPSMAASVPALPPSPPTAMPGSTAVPATSASPKLPTPTTSGSGTITKVSSGTLTLLGSNTYVGGTTTSGGALKIVGSK